MSIFSQIKLNGKIRPRCMRRGDWVEVRSLKEIQDTLDAEGKLDGLPFMPEMIQYCSRIFRVARRADKIFLDRLCYVAGLKDAVFLSELRCDGKAHDGCQMGCQLFWKEAWLKPADPPGEKIRDKNEIDPIYADYSSGQSGQLNLAYISNLPTRNGDRFSCQATELVHASKRLPWWDVRQYINELMLGETSPGELFFLLMGRLKNKLLRIVRSRNNVAEWRFTQPTPTESLNLQPGEWVEVKSLEEIEATLDVIGKNRGLGFVSEQAAFCGKRYRVAGRAEKIILEWSGEMRPLANTVKLEELTCHGRMCRSCPRNCLHLWREIWLRRAAGPM